MLLFFSFLSKALPYVALLIAMLFFIYAVIGMQVIASSTSNSRQKPCCLRWHTCGKVRNWFLLFVFSGFWENSHGRRNANQSQQQLSNLSSSRSDALQVLLISIHRDIKNCFSSHSRMFFLALWQMCHRRGLAGDHASLPARETLWFGVGLQPRRGANLWQQLRHFLLHQLLHALRFPGNF